MEFKTDSHVKFHMRKSIEIKTCSYMLIYKQNSKLVLKKASATSCFISLWKFLTKKSREGEENFFVNQIINELKG